MTWPVRHITQTVHCPPADVYRFASDPRNLPSWAAGLSAGIHEQDGAWVSDAPMGRVTIAFAASNPFGVLDHDVTLPDGTVVHNPLRVVPNDDGSELVFTVFRRPGTGDADHEKDLAAIRADLARLAARLERSST